MSHELICTWLGLPPDAWPPDHYRLLGLDPGENDLALIEQRVHQKVDSIRPYQMMHPEQATEAMTRLAEAFVCLTEPATKKAYDRSLLGVRRSVPPPLPLPSVLPSAPAVTPPPLPGPRDPLAWLYTPAAAGPPGTPPAPAVRVQPPPLPPPLPELAEAPVPAPPPPEPPEPTPEPVDEVVEAAQGSTQARRGLATKRALFRRVARTRQLLRLWHRIGKHLIDYNKRLSKQEAGDLFKAVQEIEDALENFPLLGEAGQPGHLIVNLTRLDKARALQGLTVSQRESLTRDWHAGMKFLLAHRDYLRLELRGNRQRGRVARMIRAMRAYINEDPYVAALLLLGLAAVTVALWVR